MAMELTIRLPAKEAVFVAVCGSFIVCEPSAVERSNHEAPVVRGMLQEDFSCEVCLDLSNRSK